MKLKLPAIMSNQVTSLQTISDNNVVGLFQKKISRGDEINQSI
jgi:hypothetical protein